MAMVSPFCGVHYSLNAQKLSNLVCPPYDLISEHLRCQLQRQSQYNAVFLELPKSSEQAAKQFKQWMQSGVLRSSSSPSFYFYEICYNADGRTRSFEGVIGLTKLPSLEQRCVLTHENVFEHIKQKRLQLLEQTKCNFSPVMSLYQDPKKTISSLTCQIKQHPALMQCTQANIVHSLWQISERELIQKISQTFADKTLYIADGHHRYATACAYRDIMQKKYAIDETHPANYVMMLLTESSGDGICILPTHRLISNVLEFDANRMIQKAKQYFDITLCSGLAGIQKSLQKQKQENKNSFALYQGNTFYLLSLKDHNIMNTVCSKSKAYQSLDVTVLHKLFLEQILSVNKQQISYAQSAEQACRFVDRGKACYAFLLNPVHISEVTAIADENEKMPQKSTYFYPKPITGMVFRSLK